MTYTRPTVDVLGNATALIEDTLGRKNQSPQEADQVSPSPAYDLDE